MYDFGALLKDLRVQKGYSQAMLSNKINKSKTVISNYENNIVMPPLEVLIDMAVLFNVSLDYLVGIDKKESIQIYQLSDNQKDIMRELRDEFSDKKFLGRRSELSQRQQEIIIGIMNEFMKSGRE